MARWRIRLPLQTLPLFILIAIWMLPGLVGHDPWKNDDAVGIAVAHQFLAQGDWLLPRLAGEHYVDDGPLFYWIAAAFAYLLRGALSEHDAIRLAAGACIALTLVFLRLAGRAFHEERGDPHRRGDGTMLIFMGSMGLMIHAHEAVSESALLAGLACAYYGAALLTRRPLGAALALGCGLGAALLATGPVQILPLLVALVLTPLFVADWRSRSAAGALAGAALVFAPWAVIWPALLYTRAPAKMQAWLQAEDWAALAHLPAPAEVLQALTTLAWFAWPAWPIAFWSLWLYRRKPNAAVMLLPLLALVAGVALIVLRRASAELAFLPLLLPFALIAAQVLRDLRRGAANALAWFGAMTFTLLGALIWLGYCALQTGFPPRIAANAARIEPGFVAHFAWLPFLGAIAVTLLWFALILRSENAAQRCITYWAAGIALFWSLAMLLWLPWIDQGKSYRPVALALRAALPKQYGCIASRDLGEAQRAVLDYHAGIVTRRLETHPRADCAYLLLQENARRPARHPGPGWSKVWEGNRAGDRTEKLRLYRKETKPS